MRGLLLDLRWNPGGYLRQSADIARLFLKEGEIARVDSPNPRIDKADFRADDPGAEFADVPLVVLINGQTSGGGELIAAALQDNKRAVIAGLRSIGKASIQQQLTNGVPIPGWDFKLTSGYFLRPSMHGVMPESAPEIGEASMTRRNNGRPFLASPWGVSPNAGYELPISPEMDQRLKLMWTLQTLRPGGDSSALPLDDPEADPQRQAALALLAKLLPTK
jgi:carboxyl-terminal processing protease